MVSVCRGAGGSSRIFGSGVLNITGLLLVFQNQSVESVPQFLTEEYEGLIPPDYCRVCSALITGKYFRVGLKMACPNCAVAAGFSDREEPKNGVRNAFIYGCGATAAGLAASAAISALTGWTIPILALGIGYVVGQSVRKGAAGLESRWLALIAAFLTYLAVAFGNGTNEFMRATIQSFSSTTLWERAATWSSLALISPVLQLIRAEDGGFAFLTLSAGMLIAARQAFIQRTPVLGPFFQESPKKAVSDVNTVC
jgi:hypothetical protein